MATIEDVCTACGERNPAGSAFCLYCGVYLGWNEADRQDGSSTRTPVGAPGGAPSGTTDEGSGGQRGAGYAGGAEHGGGQRGGVASGAEYGGSGHSGSGNSGAGQGGSGYGAAGRGGLGLAGEGAPGLLCPQCGHPNEVSLRFCGKCGQVLRPTLQAIRPAATQVRRSWWQRFWDPADRRARRDYRRSLPPLYRWRRVIVIVLTLAAVFAGLSVVGKNPVGWAKDRYHDLRGTLVVPNEVVYTADPPESVADNRDVAALGSPAVDDAWVTAWPQTFIPINGCGGEQAAPGMIRLTFSEPVRIRELRVLSGLPPADSQRPLFYSPRTLLVMYGADQCAQLELRRDVPEVQRLELDTKEAVASLTIAIAADAYPGRENGQQAFVAITTLTPLARPH
ncbi:hypothetical protein EV643_109155 [Kribbella sp. VKM Ac-2527]|uniref:Zinc ribbon protein n=1 Tax=Kribbella caucasensis TaxID=2512215 RepID=A0A4R6KBA6_9ACTN|nr:hypothetical protein EV643_109155 [Kribbella sp. VKM Ac-2527]